MYISKEYHGIHKKYEGAIHHVHNASSLCYIGWFFWHLRNPFWSSSCGQYKEFDCDSTWIFDTITTFFIEINTILQFYETNNVVNHFNYELCKENTILHKFRHTITCNYPIQLDVKQLAIWKCCTSNMPHNNNKMPFYNFFWMKIYNYTLWNCLGLIKVHMLTSLPIVQIAKKRFFFN